MKYSKIETAGRLVRGMIYTRALPSDSVAARQAKTRCSSAARAAMNLKQSWQKLEVQMAANFTPRDLVLTLTYRDSCLPRSKAQAVTRLKKFIRELRESRSIRGAPTYYIYCTEGYHGDKRWHHHLILNSTGHDYEEIRALWNENGDDSDFEHIDLKGYEDWAVYLTKEPREHGKPKVGERMWVPSMGLKRPTVHTSTCPDNFTLTIPKGAVVLDQSERQNAYGEYCYVKYLLPERAAPVSLGGS